MEFFDFGEFQIQTLVPHEKIIFDMLFGEFHITYRIFFFKLVDHPV